MRGRLIVYGFAGLALGIAAAGVVQIGFNVLRFMIQPAWLAGGGGAALIALLGLAVAGLVAGGVALGARRALRRGGAGLLFAAVGIGVLLDPYFLSQFGWTGPARAQALMRGLALAVAAAGLAPMLLRSGVSARVYAAAAVAAIALYAALPRFALVPALGGQLDLAAMSPIYVLVYAKGLFVLLLAAAGAIYARDRRRGTPASG